MSWLDQSAIRSSIGAEGGATLRFFGPSIHFLGGSHCLYPLKERRKAEMRWPEGLCVSTCRTWHSKRMSETCAHGAVKDVGIWGAFSSCSAAEPDLRQGGQTGGSPSIIQHPARWAFCAANDVSPPSSFRNSSASQPSLGCQVATSVLHLSSQRKNWMASDQCLLSFLS